MTTQEPDPPVEEVPNVAAMLDQVVSIVDDLDLAVTKIAARLADAALADPELVVALVSILNPIALARRNLAVCGEAAEAAIFDTMDSKRQEIPGHGVLERSRASARQSHDPDALLAEVLERATVDPETGEVLLTAAAKARLTEVLRLALPLTPSLSWRHTGLDQLAIDWRPHHSKTQGRKVVRLL